MKIGAKSVLVALDKALASPGDDVILPRWAAQDARALMKVLARQDDGEGVIVVFKARQGAFVVDVLVDETDMLKELWTATLPDFDTERGSFVLTKNTAAAGMTAVARLIRGRVSALLETMKKTDGERS